MKTEAYYNNKIKTAELEIVRYRNRIDELKNPKPLKPIKEKTKIISFRVPVKQADILKQKVTEFLNQFIK